MNSRYLIQFIILKFLFINLVSSQTMTKEEAFFYFLRANNLSLDSPTYSEKGSEKNYCGSSYLDYYVKVIDNSNYMKIRNDEFERASYYQKTYLNVENKINSLNFNKIFSIYTKAEFGEYNFIESAFPIFIPTNHPLYFDNSCRLSVYTDEFINIDDFEMKINLPSEAAKSFINSRKDNLGNINRSVDVRINYSVVNRQSSKSKGFLAKGGNVDIYIHSIEISNIKVQNKNFITLVPKISYYDKIHGVKQKDGAVTIYYDSKWNITNNKANASYYRVINFKGGFISGPVNDYFISGKVQMQGFYPGYRALDGYGFGLFTWYYENGNKSLEANFINGKKTGKLTKWYDNGMKKEEVFYVNDLMEGCQCVWNETGEPDNWPSKYFDYYQKGQRILYDKRCPTYSSKDESKNLENLNKTFPFFSNENQRIEFIKSMNISIYKEYFRNEILAHNSDAIQTESGLMIIFHDKDTGEKPFKNNRVTLWIKELRSTNQQNLTAKNEAILFSFIVGSGKVISGIDEGICMIKKGSKATFFIPYYLAYGVTGYAEVSPYANIIYEVELMEFE